MTCWCGAPARGPVVASQLVGPHECQQCAEHCALEAYMASRPAPDSNPQPRTIRGAR